MRVAIGGGRGFIGSALGAAFAAAGHQVLAFSREGLPAGADVDVLVWAGGRRGDDPAILQVQHVAAPAAALLHAGPALRRLVYLSSAEVYGDAPVPFREDGPVVPQSVYARTKLGGEAALAAQATARGATMTALRLAVVYGPGQPPPMLIPSALMTLRAGKPFVITGDGLQTRDFLHVDDLARLVVRAAAADAPAGVYNAGTGREVAAIEAARLLGRYLGGAEREALVAGGLPVRRAEQRRYVVDPSRAERALGWRAQVTLEQGLQRLAEHVYSASDIK